MNTESSLLNNRLLPYLLLLCMMLVSGLVLWPGVMRVDSAAQFAQAISGQYTDAHPPMLSWVWSGLHFLYPGSGLVMVVQLSLLYASMCFMIRTFEDSYLKWFFVCIPFWPHIFGFAGFILKDIHFAFSFLLVASYLSFCTIARKEISKPAIISILILLFYGLSVKYQARFILPVLVVWLCYAQRHYIWEQAVFKRALILLGILYGSLALFHQATVTKEDHFWQYVKLFDLSAISIAQNEAIFPRYVLEHEGFAFAGIKKHFNPSRVDELINAQRFFPKAETSEQLNELQTLWWQTVLHHPGDYFAHRMRLHDYLLKTPMIKKIEDVASFQEMVPVSLSFVLAKAQHYGLIDLLSEMTSFRWYVPLLLMYFCLGCLSFRRCPYGEVLFMFSAMALLLEMVLFFFSMASDARYLYFSVCCLHMCHPFAWALLQTTFTQNSVEPSLKTC